MVLYTAVHIYESFVYMFSGVECKVKSKDLPQPIHILRYYQHRTSTREGEFIYISVSLMKKRKRMYLICLIFVNHIPTMPVSDKSDKSVSLYFRFWGNHRSHRLKGSFSLALVIEISKIPKICGYVLGVPISLIFNAFWEIYQYIKNFFLEFRVNMYMVG